MLLFPKIFGIRWSRVFLYSAFGLLISVISNATASVNRGILYPQESESREVKSLDGVWNFRQDDRRGEGFDQKWYEQDLAKSGAVIPMPVPSSYNDITEDTNLRDHCGYVWYDRTFFIPDGWRSSNFRIWLRFGSVQYSAVVYINGHKVMEHEIGHLPFEAEITSFVYFGKSNRITVAVNNVLTNITIPQGELQHLLTDNGTKVFQGYTFDFFNYAGIHRSVFLYTTPTVYIDDITINTDIDGSTGLIYYNITPDGSISGNDDLRCTVTLLDKLGNEVTNVRKIEDANGFSGKLIVRDATFWWPYLMNPNPGYLYTIQVRQQAVKYKIEDIYRLKVGIRTVRWGSDYFRINGKPAYIRGVGRHEDSDLRGKGLDFPLIAKDYNLIKWLGINAYRTSHYPYAEEIMDFADKEGIMIIDECPAVNIDLFSSTLLKKHMDSLSELIRRDKNRPSVVMWSIANEPRSANQGAGNYFRSISEYVKELDETRPITAANDLHPRNDHMAQYLDIIGFNRYNGWYQNAGKLDTIQVNVVDEATAWHAKHNKPVLMTEYGADTMPGLHFEPAYIWSEEYQVQLLSEHFKAFDTLRGKKFFIGEMIWNFADFKTDQSYIRVGGNRKGILTRERQPKTAAFHVRERYFKLAQIVDGYKLPKNLRLNKYTAPNVHYTNKIEL